MLCKHNKDVFFFFPQSESCNPFKGNVGLQQQAGAVWWLYQRGRAAERSTSGAFVAHGRLTYCRGPGVLEVSRLLCCTHPESD